MVLQILKWLYHTGIGTPVLTLNYWLLQVQRPKNFKYQNFRIESSLKLTKQHIDNLY